MTGGSPTRRGFLAAAGGALLAGCNGRPFSEDDATTISSHRLPDVTDDDGDADPILAEALPVDIEQAALDERGRRVTALLDTLPIPFTAAQIPNGYIRQQIVDAAADATTHLHDARTAQTRFAALQALRHARERARYAAAGWAAVAAGQTQAALQEAHQQAVTEARAVRSAHEYLGTDPVRAALVHARIERNLGLVLDRRQPRGEASSTVLTVAEWGEHAESARALTDDTRYLRDRYTASLPDGAESVEERLATAAETLAASLRSRRDDLPPEPTEHREEPGWRLRYRLRDEAASSARQVADADGPAGAVLAAVEGFTDFLAYERVRTQRAADDPFRVESAADIADRRNQALEAIRTALERSSRPALARPTLVTAAASVAYADEALARYRGDVRLARLHDPLRQYITATVRARSVPAASQQVLDALTD